MSEHEKKTFTTQEGPNRGREKPGPDKEPQPEQAKPKEEKR